MIEKPGAGREGRSRWSALLLFSAATFLFWASLYLYVPILPAYAESQGASLSVVGAVIASYAIAQLLLRAPLGMLADFMGRRKPFVAAGLVCASLGAIAMGLAPGPWFLFAGRTITGVAATTWVISSVFFVSYFPPERAARGIGIISFVNSTAMVAATLAGGYLAELLGAKSVFFIGAGLGVTGALVLIPVAEPTVYRSGKLTIDAVRKIAGHPVVLISSLMSALVHFGGAATFSSFTLVYATRIGASSTDLGLLSAAYLGSATLTTLVAVYLVERKGYASTIFLGALVMGATFAVMPAIDGLGLFVVVQAISGAGRGLANTALMALSISAVPPAQRATAMGVYQAIYSIGMLTGPLAGGLAATSLGLEAVFYMSAASVLVAGGLAFSPTLRGH